MAVEFDFTSPTDKPALIAVSSPGTRESVKLELQDLGYKVHEALNHEDFLVRFAQLQYHVIVMEETFQGSKPEENLALRTLQRMQMSIRRHVVIVLVGENFTTLNTLQAFQNSVHAVVNLKELDSLGKITQQTVAEVNLAYATYRDVQNRIAQGKL